MPSEGTLFEDSKMRSTGHANDTNQNLTEDRPEIYEPSKPKNTNIL